MYELHYMAYITFRLDLHGAMELVMCSKTSVIEFRDFLVEWVNTIGIIMAVLAIAATMAAERLREHTQVQ